MIKINLLEESRGAKKQAFTMPTIDASAGGNTALYVVYIAIIVLTIAAVGFWGWKLKADLASLKQQVKEAEAEKRRLEAVIKIDRELRAKQKELKRKIEVITNLKKKQEVPVQLMDMLSKNLPEFVWLESLSFSGSKVSLKGKGQSMFAISNFLKNLEESPHFVGITLGPIRGDLVLDFSLVFSFTLAEEGNP